MSRPYEQSLRASDSLYTNSCCRFQEGACSKHEHGHYTDPRGSASMKDRQALLLSQGKLIAMQACEAKTVGRLQQEPSDAGQASGQATCGAAGPRMSTAGSMLSVKLGKACGCSTFQRGARQDHSRSCLLQVQVASQVGKHGKHRQKHKMMWDEQGSA